MRSVTGRCVAQREPPPGELHLPGRGEDDGKVREWLAAARGVPGFVGFAVGRTAFWNALVDWRANRLTREGALRKLRSGTASSSIPSTLHARAA